jgi:hypothetical protein
VGGASSTPRNLRRSRCPPSSVAVRRRPFRYPFYALDRRLGTMGFAGLGSHASNGAKIADLSELMARPKIRLKRASFLQRASVMPGQMARSHYARSPVRDTQTVLHCRSRFSTAASAHETRLLVRRFAARAVPYRAQCRAPHRGLVRLRTRLRLGPSLVARVAGLFGAASTSRQPSFEWSPLGRRRSIPCPPTKRCLGSDRPGTSLQARNRQSAW